MHHPEWDVGIWWRVGLREGKKRGLGQNVNKLGSMCCPQQASHATCRADRRRSGGECKAGPEWVGWVGGGAHHKGVYVAVDLIQAVLFQGKVNKGVGIGRTHIIQSLQGKG